MMPRILTLLTTVLALSFQMSNAQTNVTLNPSQDNTVYSESGSLSNGSGDYLFVGRTAGGGGDVRRALLKFDLTSIPPGSTINSVSLNLTVSRVHDNTARNAHLHPLEEAWGEGSSNASGQEGSGATASTGDATWTTPTFNQGGSWTGGNHNTAESGTVSITGNGAYTWNDPALTADVQNWVNNPALNFGWAIHGVENQTATAKRFNSRENSDVSSRPALIINYTAAAPTNDLCGGAIAIDCGETVTGSTTGANDTGQPSSSCGGTSPQAGGVWYSFIGNGADITASLCGSSYDTKLHVFSGSCNNLVCEAGNDDDCSLQSEVSFASQAGTTYYVLVNGFGTAQGDYTLSLNCVIANDDCSGAISVSCGQTISGSTDGATIGNDPTTSCGTTPAAPGVWYKITGSGNDITASLCGSSYDTKLNVYSGSCNNLICVDGNDDFCGLQSEVTFTAAAGTEYYLLVNGFGSGVGAFDLEISCTSACSPVPGNDLCTNATALNVNSIGGCGGIFGTNACASPAANTSPCVGGGTVYDVWYSFNTGANTDMIFTFAPISAGSLSFAIYDGCGNNALVDTCDFSGDVGIINFQTNTTYLLQVWTNAQNTGSFNVCIQANAGVNCNPPTGLQVSNIQTNRADLNWACDASAESYTVRGNMLGRSGSITLNLNPGCNVPQRVSGLAENTSYWWQIRANCGDGLTSGWSQRDTFTTLGACESPIGLNTVNISATSARLTWSAVAGATGYVVVGRRVGGSNVTVNVSGGSTTGLNTGQILSPSTDYSWEVSARCAGNVTSAPSATSFFTTATSKSYTGGVKEFDGTGTWSAYPNPASHLVNFEITADLANELHMISVRDISGKLVYQEAVYHAGLITINTSDWSKGIYQAAIEGPSLSTSEKLVITH